MAYFRANLNLTSTSNKRYTDEITFGGVDYASPRLLVSQGHAIDLQNYVYRDHAVQKRFGCDFFDVTTKKFYYDSMDPKDTAVISNKDSSGTKLITNNENKGGVYDIWSYRSYVIFHIGRMLFYAKYSEIRDQFPNYRPIAFRDTGSQTVDKVTRTIYRTIAFPAKRLNAFVSNGSLWILTGEYLYKLTETSNGVFTLLAVTEKGTPYIPETTIGIVQSESEGYATRTTFEQSNLLTPYRKNGCVGGIKNKDEKCLTYSYTLDSTADSLSEIKITYNDMPYSNIGTMSCKASPGHKKDDSFVSNDFGFNYPYCGQKYALFGGDTYGRKGFVVFTNSSNFNGLDFGSFTVIGKGGEQLKFKATANMPPVVFEDGLPFPDTKTSGEGRGKVEYDSGAYYVRIYGYKNLSEKIYLESDYPESVTGPILDTSREITRSDPSLTKWTASDFKKNDDGYYPYYAVLIYAKIDGDIRYCCLTADFKETDLTYKLTNGFDSSFVDGNDYLGNAVAIKEVKVTNTSTINFRCPISFARLFNDGTITFTPNTFYDKAGKHLQSGISINSVDQRSFYQLLYGQYHENEITLVPVLYNKDDKYVPLSQQMGILSKVDIPYKDDEKLYFLLDKFSTTQDGDTYKARRVYNIAIYGYFIKGTDKVVLFQNIGGQYDGDSNIVITFKATGHDTAKQDINKCTFGIQYGTQNYKNRLFVSGNKDNPCCDWHSGDGSTDGEMDYFPSDSVCKYGNETPVVGYGIVSDGKLLVVKEASDKEPSVFYRTATYAIKKDDYGKAVTDTSGNSTYTESYPMTQTNSHIGALDNHCFADFNGDSIFVDTDGRIVGLDNEGTTYDNQRVASTRSALIDPKLRKCSKKDIRDTCILIADGDDLFYATPNELWYTQYDVKYEWFKMSIAGIKAYCHMRYGDFDQRIFGSETSIIIPRTDRFSDGYAESIETGSMLLGADGKITASEYIASLINDGYSTIYHKGEYSVILASTDKIDKPSSDLFRFAIPTGGNMIAEGNVPISCFNSSGKEVGTIYAEITLSDIFEDGYLWYEVNSDYFSSNDISRVEILRNVPDYAKFSVKRDGSNDLVATFDETDYDIFHTFEKNNDCVVKKTPVSAYYCTAPYLSESLAYRKTIDSYTIVSDMGRENEIYVKMLTNNVSLDEIVEAGGQVDYSNIDYLNVNYTRYDLPHTQTLRLKFYGNFIALSLASPSDRNSTLTKLQFIYHYAGRTYGKN